MKFLVVALFCLSAEAFAAPSKTLEDDVAIARMESVNFEVEAVIFENELNIFNEKIDLQIRPISLTIIDQLENLNISSTNVTAIRDQFSNSFILIQDGFRGVNQVLAETRKTLERIISDLDESRWNNLREQDKKLRDELAVIDSRYTSSKNDIIASNLELETSLINVLEGQETLDVVEVLSNMQQIKDIFAVEVGAVDDIKIIYDVRGSLTLNALDVVLDQV